MLQDVNTIFSGAIAANGTRTAQAITATANSTNVLDSRINGAPALVDLGLVEDCMWLIVNVVQAFNTLTSLQIDLVSDSNVQSRVVACHALLEDGAARRPHRRCTGRARADALGRLQGVPRGEVHGQRLEPDDRLGLRVPDDGPAAQRRLPVGAFTLDV
jgi:hypothetical protein